jgi:type II secretory pathway pseudopilin PulG
MELLVVIAIIAILAALLFPVFGRVREQTHQTQCFTNMHDIYRAAKLYKEDNNKYPASLLGFVQYLDSNNNAQYYTGTGQPLAVDQLVYKPLFNGQKYLNDKTRFACPDEQVKDLTQITTAVYPSFPGIANAGKPVSFTPLIQHNTGNDANASYPNGQNAYFYTYDSYDIGPQLNASGQLVPNVLELHYNLDWTGGSGANDAANQMKYPQTAPEDHTVLTWCSDHAAYAGADKVLVIMLTGTTRPVDAKLFVTQGPLGL